MRHSIASHHNNFGLEAAHEETNLRLKITSLQGEQQQRNDKNEPYSIRINIRRYYGFIQDDAKALKWCPHHLVRIAR